MSGYDRENRNVLRRCLKTVSDGAAVTWAGRPVVTYRSARSCECATGDCRWSVRAADQSRTNAVVVVTACLPSCTKRDNENYCILLGRIALVAQRPIAIKLFRGRSVGLCVSQYLRRSVCAVHCGKNGGSDPDVIWYRSCLLYTSPSPRD